ncbi:unnamed protein product [Ceratitis capitata]|uniref:(Mediterranean fruit fly) hypothetical protein n=1 Tax=Ceratitis capitata TaxID=7213 RepID=A0A811UCQ6_CERCA|nr:unnamed protein product [Ceratitis capitata]
MVEAFTNGRSTIAELPREITIETLTKVCGGTILFKDKSRMLFEITCKAKELATIRVEMDVLLEIPIMLLPTRGSLGVSPDFSVPEYIRKKLQNVGVESDQRGIV